MNPALTGLPATKQGRNRAPETMLLLCHCVERMSESLYRGVEITPEAVQAILALMQRVDGLKVAWEARLEKQGVQIDD